MTKKGKFIVFEGGEGAGKTLATAMLKDYFASKGIHVITTREPGGCPAAEETRTLIMNHEWSKQAEVYLFAAARLQHCHEKITPALESGSMVISDRYTPSSYVYQGIVGECGLDAVVEANKHAEPPDMVIYFDVDPEIGLKRIFSNSEREVTRFDKASLDVHHKWRAAYKSLADKGLYKDFRIVNANQTPEEVLEDLKAIVDELL